MKQQIEARLAALKQEYTSGQNVLADLHKKEDEVRTTLMRISGAIQVLEEMLGDGGEQGAQGRSS